MLLRLRLYFRILKSKGLADQFVQVANRPQIRLGAGQKGLDPDVDGKTALDAADDGALDGAVFVVGLFDRFPHLDLGGLFLGQDDPFLLVVPPLDHHFDRIADLGLDLARSHP